MSLATKYRPHVFEDVVEQSITSRILKRQIELKKFKHAYLFSGASGCGKTTAARIMANAINEIANPSEKGYIELDAASNNGVDQIRAIVEDAKLRDVTYDYKIFIIDECHMITTAGWNAFLKAIEEPSEYTIYIFCTTEPNKIPETILNRLQRYNFGKISNKGIYSRLETICKSEGYINYNDSLDLIVKSADGSMRDAITTLEQCADLNIDLSIQNVKEVIGDLSTETMLRLTNTLISKDEKSIFEIISNMYTSGKDLKAFLNSYLSFVLDINKYLQFRTLDITSIPLYLEQDIRKTVCSCGNNINEAVSYLNRLAEVLLDIKIGIRFDTSYHNTIIVKLIKFSC